MLSVLAQAVHKSYRQGRRKVPALRGVDLQIEQGEVVALTGPSGCGKTTLLNCLAGLDRPDTGRILVDGQDLVRMNDRARTRHRGRRMGFVFQSFNLVPVMTAQENVELPLRLLGGTRSSARARARRALDSVGLLDRASHKPLELSGGQQQRVAIARALVNEPAIVWADEPTGNLDAEAGAEILDLFHTLNRDHGTSFLLVTHAPEVAQSAHRTIRMVDGRIT